VRVKWNLKMALVACLIALASMLGTIAAHAVTTDPAPQESGQARKVQATRTALASVKVDPAGEMRYELSIARCRQPECPFQVRLLRGKALLSSVHLDWVKASGPATKDTVDESSGVGDPLRPDTDQAAWSTGAEKENVSTVARGVQLTQGLTGLLIDRRAGFDVLKRHHDLYVAVNRKLVLAWNDEDGPGPSWSTVALSGLSKDGSQDILSFRGFHSPSGADPDRLSLDIYHWNASQNKLVARQRPEASAVIAGTYDSASKAREVQNGASCLDSFWVLRSEGFSALTPGKFVLAAVTGRKELADKKADEIKACTTQLNLSVIRSMYHSPDE
jgi:hypothetical protein